MSATTRALAKARNEARATVPIARTVTEEPDFTPAPQPQPQPAPAAKKKPAPKRKKR
mgnify:CR=1 FL=1